MAYIVLMCRYAITHSLSKADVPLSKFYWQIIIPLRRSGYLETFCHLSVTVSTELRMRRRPLTEGVDIPPP